MSKREYRHEFPPPPNHVPGTPYDAPNLAAKRGEKPERGPKEVVYDEKIAPLMAQIIAIANESKINLGAAFYLDIRDDQPIVCRTVIAPDADDKVALQQLREFRLLLQHGTLLGL